MLSGVIKGNIVKKKIKKYLSVNDLFFSTIKDTKDFFKNFFMFGSMEHNRSNIIYIYQTKYMLYIFIYIINIYPYIPYKIVLALYPSELTYHSLLEADLACHQHLRWSSCDKS